jgi:hypothetical protein
VPGELLSDDKPDALAARDQGDLGGEVHERAVYTACPLVRRLAARGRRWRNRLGSSVLA